MRFCVLSIPHLQCCTMSVLCSSKKMDNVVNSRQWKAFSTSWNCFILKSTIFAYRFRAGFCYGQPQRAGTVGGPVWWLQQHSPVHHRPVHQLGSGQMGQTEWDRPAAATRHGGNGMGTGNCTRPHSALEWRVNAELLGVLGNHPSWPLLTLFLLSGSGALICAAGKISADVQRWPRRVSCKFLKLKHSKANLWIVCYWTCSRSILIKKGYLSSTVYELFFLKWNNIKHNKHRAKPKLIKVKPHTCQ